MSDMFGRYPHQYTVVRALMADERWEEHQAGHAARFRIPLNPQHNFDALGFGPPREFDRATDEQQSVGYMTDNLLSLQTQADEILYTRFRLLCTWLSARTSRKGP